MERRDIALRLKRDAIAAWFGIHPSELAGVSAEAIHIMAARLEDATLQQAELAALRAQAARWERLARTDSLTGLASRRAVEERIEAEIDRARRTGRPLAVLLADVDHLKQVNDRHGHAAGDAVLRAVASRIERAVRRTDVAGRWGGDEFIVVCPDTGAEAAQRVADKLVTVVSGRPVALPVLHLPVHLSVGWAVLGPDDDAASLVAAADEHLYRAKVAGRSREIAEAPRREPPPTPPGSDLPPSPIGGETPPSAS